MDKDIHSRKEKSIVHTQWTFDLNKKNDEMIISIK